MAKVMEFMAEKSIPNAGFHPNEEANMARNIGVITFKKTKLSHDVGLAWEHFNNFVGYTEPDSLERIALVRDLFRELDVPYMPTVLAYPHMYV